MPTHAQRPLSIAFGALEVGISDGFFEHRSVDRFQVRVSPRLVVCSHISPGSGRNGTPPVAVERIVYRSGVIRRPYHYVSCQSLVGFWNRAQDQLPGALDVVRNRRTRSESVVLLFKVFAGGGIKPLNIAAGQGVHTVRDTVWGIKQSEPVVG